MWTGVSGGSKRFDRNILEQKRKPTVPDKSRFNSVEEEVYAKRRDRARTLRAEGKLLREIGKELGVTRERARQLTKGIPKPNLSDTQMSLVTDPIAILMALREAGNIFAASRLLNVSVSAIKRELRRMDRANLPYRLQRWKYYVNRRKKQEWYKTEFKALADKLGRTPSGAEFAKVVGLKPAAIVPMLLRYFGHQPLTVLAKAAGYPPRKQGEQVHKPKTKEET